MNRQNSLREFASRQRWHTLMPDFGLPANDGVYSELVRAYSQRHRHYHTLDHLGACLFHLDQVRKEIARAHEIEMALWFHDAVYDPHSGDNELESAKWAESFLRHNGVDIEVVDRVYSLIMATRARCRARAKR